MKIILLLIFIFFQVGEAASSPPTSKDDGRIIISQDELESFLRLLVIKKMELEIIESTIIEEQSIQKSFETPLAPIAEKTQKTQAEPILQKETVGELQKETLRKQDTDLKPSPANPAITIGPTQFEDTFEKLEKTIKTLNERLLTIENYQKETKIEISQQEPKKTVSDNNLKERVEISPEPSSLDQRLKAQAEEISYLRKMVEDLLSIPTTTAERPISTITPQQPIYVLSSQQSPISRQLFENRGQETNDERLRELIEKMNLALENGVVFKTEAKSIDSLFATSQEPPIPKGSIKSLPHFDQTTTSLLTNGNNTEEIHNAQDFDIPELREPDVELQLMIENSILKMEVEQLANEMNNLRTEFLQLETTVGEMKKTNIEEIKQDPMLLGDKKFSVFFANNSSDLTASDLEIVKNIVKKVAINATYNIVLNGYSSITGPAEYNMKLSRRRAEVVRKALIANGLVSDRISLFYYGTDPKTTEENARRVEIVITTINETEALEP